MSVIYTIEDGYYNDFRENELHEKVGTQQSNFGNYISSKGIIYVLWFSKTIVCL